MLWYAGLVFSFMLSRLEWYNKQRQVNANERKQEFESYLQGCKGCCFTPIYHLL